MYKKHTNTLKAITNFVQEFIVPLPIAVLHTKFAALKIYMTISQETPKICVSEIDCKNHMNNL